MRYAILLLALMCGCASMTFNDISGAISKGISLTANQVRLECGNVEVGGPCVETSLITTEDRDAVQGFLRKALEARETARAAWVAGDTEQAYERLRAAQALLDTVEKYLAERGVE